MAASFMTLPPELREMIYDLVFTTTPPTQNSMALMYRVPTNLALRFTCTFIANESHRSFLKATRHYDTLRSTLFEEILTYTETVAAPVQATGIHPTQAIATNLHNLALGLFHPNPQCKHACAEMGCYMCSDPQHQSCFDCGRNLAIALYCRLPDHKNEAPHLIAPCSEGLPTALGAWIQLFPKEHAIARRAETMFAMYVPDAASCTGFKQGMGLVPESIPFALRWWRHEFHRQWFVDLRCVVRRRAVGQFYFGGTGKHGFTESWILKLESQNSKWPIVQQLGKHFADCGFMRWKGEYRRRVELEAEMKGWDVSRFVPPFDEERLAKTCYDAEWFV